MSMKGPLNGLDSLLQDLKKNQLFAHLLTELVEGLNLPSSYNEQDLNTAMRETISHSDFAESEKQELHEAYEKAFSETFNKAPPAIPELKEKMKVTSELKEKPKEAGLPEIAPSMAVGYQAKSQAQAKEPFVSKSKNVKEEKEEKKTKSKTKRI